MPLNRSVHQIAHIYQRLCHVLGDTAKRCMFFSAQPESIHGGVGEGCFFSLVYTVDDLNDDQLHAYHQLRAPICEYRQINFLFDIIQRCLAHQSSFPLEAIEIGNLGFCDNAIGNHHLLCQVEKAVFLILA